MIDKLFKRFRRSQPWSVVLAAGVIEAAMADINAVFAPGPPRANALRKLDKLLLAVQADPLDVLGHPPVGTDDPNVFRYTADEQKTVSFIADLDETARELVIIQINIKGASHGGH